MGDIALPYILPRIQNPQREVVKYLNFLTALYERRQGATTLSAKPIDITIDFTTTCQLHCPYCAVGNGTMGRTNARMSADLHQRLVTELADTTFISWLFSTGEPLLHKQLPEMLALQKDREVFSVISTNLSLPLSDQKIDALLNCGLGMISASVDGASAETYSQYRVGGDFNLVLDNLRRLVTRKKALGLEFPLIEWRFLLFRHNQHEVEAARAIAADIGVDLLEFWTGHAPTNAEEGRVQTATIAFPANPISGTAYDRALVKQETALQRFLLNPPPGFDALLTQSQSGTIPARKCDWLYYSGMIYPNGSFGPCCVATDESDDFTSLHEHATFQEAWNAPNFIHTRRAFQLGEKAGTVCDRCPAPAAQHQQFIQKVRGILRNAPDWAIRILAGNPAAFFFDMDYALLPQETVAIREGLVSGSGTGAAELIDFRRELSGEMREKLDAHIGRFMEFAAQAPASPAMTAGESMNRSSSATAPAQVDPRRAADSERYLVATALASSGNKIEASEHLIALVEENTPCWEPYCDLASLAAEQLEDELASELFELAIEREGEPGRSRRTFAAFLHARGTQERALAVLSPVLRAGPDDGEALALARRIVEASGPLSAVAWARLVGDLRAGTAGEPAPGTSAVKDPIVKSGIGLRVEGGVCIDSAWEPSGVTEQFLEAADTYHERQFNIQGWKFMLSRALSFVDIDRDAPIDILDVGSGSGNTVLAAAELFTQAAIVASDISPNLLRILDSLQNRYPVIKGRLKSYCFDLHKDFFVSGSFDLVIGGAILHHLLQPEISLTNIARWLKPGGRLILFEPLEIGGHIQAAIYHTLIAELEDQADPRIIGHFRGMCNDFDCRYGAPNIKPWTAKLDDKWLFSPSCLRQLGAETGFELEVLEPIAGDLTHLFRDRVRSLIANSGLDDVPLPERMWTILDQFDSEISEHLKRRMSLEGIVIFRRRVERSNLIQPAAESERLRLSEAEKLAREGDPEQAVQILISLVEAGTSLWEPYFELAREALAQDESGMARELLEQAARLEPVPGPARSALAGLLARQGDHEAALAALGPTIRSRPNDIEVLDSLRDLLGACNRLGAVAWARLVADLRFGRHDA